MGPVQPRKRNERIPQYSWNQLAELQQKIANKFELLGVFKSPTIGVAVEYINPSFLVNEPYGSFWLVTALANAGRYRKQLPPLMLDVDSTLWKKALFIITTDKIVCSDSFVTQCHEILWCCNSFPRNMCVRVYMYARSFMGMSGPETEKNWCAAFLVT